MKNREIGLGAGLLSALRDLQALVPHIQVSHTRGPFLAGALLPLNLKIEIDFLVFFFFFSPPLASENLEAEQESHDTPSHAEFYQHFSGQPAAVRGWALLQNWLPGWGL